MKINQLNHQNKDPCNLNLSFDNRESSQCFINFNVVDSKVQGKGTPVVRNENQIIAVLVET